MYTLKDFTRLFDESGLPAKNITEEQLIQVMEYYESIKEIGNNILSGRKDEENMAIIAIIQSAVCFELWTGGNISPNDLKFLLSPDFVGVLIRVIRGTVGLAALEELR